MVSGHLRVCLANCPEFGRLKSNHKFCLVSPGDVTLLVHTRPIESFLQAVANLLLFVRRPFPKRRCVESNIAAESQR